MDRYRFHSYSETFSIVYDRRWGELYTTKFTPPIIEFLERHVGIAPNESSVCDLCCGTGQTTMAFAERGYAVQSVDRSAGMLNRCRINNKAFIESGSVSVSQQDAQSYSLPSRVNATVSLFDSLNHLDSTEALDRCFCSVAEATVPGGSFLFDLNTRKGLNGWNAINIDESDDWFVVTRGTFSEGMDRAYTSVSGFVSDQGEWKRFSEVIYNTAFELANVETALRDSGWEEIELLDPRDMSSCNGDPEELNRVFFLARKVAPA